MPDNTRRIAELEAILQSGARSVSVDGVSTQIDLDAIRRERDRLVEADDTRGNERPTVCGINFGNF